MQLTLRDGLPYLMVSLQYAGNVLSIEHVLLDTGSASTIFAANILSRIGISPLPDDNLEVIQGVGGSEVVFSRQIDSIAVDSCVQTNFVIEVGAMDYGFGINGILGMDLLLRSNAVINLPQLAIEFSNS